MTVSSEDFGAGPLEGNGSNTAFPYTGKFDTASEMQVLHTDADGTVTELTADVHFTVSGLGDTSGTVTYPKSGSGLATLPSGEYITIEPNLPYKQQSNLRSAGGYSANVIENALDYGVRLAQQVRNLMTRTIRINRADGATIDGELPIAASSTGRYLALNAARTGMELADNPGFLEGEIVYFNGLSAMRGSSPTNATTYWLRYHTSEGDGGGGMFRGVTGAAVGTYTDDNGVVIVPTGGDGSAAFIREGAYLRARAKASWFGIVPDIDIAYSGGWTFSGGTDQAAAINAAIAAGYNQLEFDEGGYSIQGQLDLTSRGMFIGKYMFTTNSGSGGTWFVFSGGVTEDCISPAVDEVSSCHVRGIRFVDVRTTVTAGVAVNANKAVNGVWIDECFFLDWDYGGAFVGADSNLYAGDDIHMRRCWMQNCGAGSGWSIGLGNFNNIAKFDDIYGGGEYTVIKRTNGNALSGAIIINGVQHEITTGAAQTIETAADDKVSAIGVTRRSSTGNAGATIKPVSSRGNYLNILHTKSDGSGQQDKFHDASGNVVSEAENIISQLGGFHMVGPGGAGTDEAYLNFDANGDPYFTLSNSTTTRVKLHPFAQNFWTMYLNASSLMKVSNTGDTGAIAGEFDTNSGTNSGSAIKGNRSNGTDTDGIIIDAQAGGSSVGGFIANASVTGGCVIRLGSKYLWHDSTGDLRTHTSNPTSDTDGAVVGTQS